jgi:L-amino acid N-acyltransferase YncA/ubiquinone/menaquinone biosynthesis C-methylase UbiE
MFGPALYGEEAGDAPAAAVNASLGCGVPTAVADLHEGETVLDLGSGAGADVLISARRVGDTGRAIGLDMTDEMLDLARANAAAAGVGNVEFVKGYIEDIPLADNSVDVVISNCVINLAGDKRKALAEAARVLRPGGRFAISDVIADPDMDAATRADMAAYTGCIAGALTEAEFRSALDAAGLTDVEIRHTHRVHEHAGSAIVRARKPRANATRFRLAAEGDLPAVVEAYNAGIEERLATFETEPRTVADLAAWMTDGQPFVVAERDGRVIGFARAGAYSDRCVYTGVGEHAVYVARDARGQGLGRQLLEQLVAECERRDFYKLTSRVFSDNPASLAAHRAAGFEEVGVQRRHGKLDGVWKDCVLVERLLGEAAADDAPR